MNRLLALIFSGVAAFVATNIDDLVILTIFLAQPERFRWQRVVIGQYLGMAALVLVSLPGFFGGLMVPKPVIGLLGLVPIAIGLSQWLKHKSSESELQSVNLPVTAASPEFPETTSRQGEKERQPFFAIALAKLSKSAAHLLHPQTYSVAAVTFANGGDNVGIYIPLFASSNFANLLVILATFFLMIGLWCYLAYGLTRHPVVSTALIRYGDTLVPVVLIGLGIYILIENGTVEWLRGKGF